MARNSPLTLKVGQSNPLYTVRIKKVCCLGQQQTQHWVSIDSVSHGVAVNTHVVLKIYNKYSITFWTFDWHSKPTFSCDIPAYDDISQYQFG